MCMCFAVADFDHPTAQQMLLVIMLFGGRKEELNSGFPVGADHG